MPPKRKRYDRPSGDAGRPSPHRPGDASLAHHDRDDGPVRGRGRGYRGGGMNRRDSGQGHGRGGHNRQPSQSPARGSGNFASQVPPQSPPARPPPPQSNPAPPNPSSPTKTMSRPPLVSAKPPPEPTQEPISSNRQFYIYDHLTSNIINTWANGGRDQVVQHGVQSRDDVDITELSCLFQEFIHAVAENRLNPTEAGACVNEILGEEQADVIKDSYTFAPHTLLLDSLAIVTDNDADLYQPALRDFLIATGVSLELMRQVLDAPILQRLGLIRDNFARLGVRQATNLLYRQANYNLLREETEGYSKLITELFSTNSAAPPPPELAAQTFERVKALIGTFDLDVGRVLDVTLDVAAAVLIKQFKFFVKFLRVSSWWPRSQYKSSTHSYASGLPVWAAPDYQLWSASEEDEEWIARRKLERDIVFWDRVREVHLNAFFELGGRELANSSSQQRITNGHASEAAVAEVESQWVKETQTLPPPGNRVAAQLLGFKLLFYNSELRDAADVLPANLLYLAALLIKIGFISLTDLYPHLSPADEGMEQVRDEELKRIEIEERASRGGAMNALLMAGVLPQGEDDNPSTSGSIRKEPLKKVEPDAKQSIADETDSNKKKLPDPLEQKVSLLIQLLTIGALPEALFILGRFPWIPETFPDVLSRIHRILHVAVDKVYNDGRPTLATSTDCPTKQVPDVDQSGITKGSVRLSRLASRKVWRWPYPDKADTNENQTYRFYWDEWADNIPVCQTVDDIFSLCSTLLNISGVNIGKDEALLSKLASIGARSLADDTSEANLGRWHDLLRRLLLPALSHTKANASVVNAIWVLLKHYPLATRYSMYAEWFEGQTSRIPAMKVAFARATSETRGTMKRVSLTNLSEMAKQLAKTSYSSPGIVFRVAFEQLESYPNLIDAFVECAKYFTELSYDVLVWSLMNSLGKSRSRTQADHALTTSKWLTALSKFSGKVFRRYPLLNPTPVLQYVNEQLFRGNSTDLIILREFISSMGGIVDAVDFSDYQILSMAGGAFLRQQTLIRGQDRRFDNVKSSRRLIQALTESKLASRFLINLAQYRQSALFQIPDDEAHIKFLSSIVDDSHQILIQYLDFLWSNLDSSEFDALVPSIPELINSYGLDPSLAFLIGRASLAHRIFPWKAKKLDTIKEKVRNKKAETDKDGDVAMVDGKSSNDSNSAQDAAPAANDQAKSDDPSLIRSTLQPMVDLVRERSPLEDWNKITPDLYVTFWALQLGDLFCPEDMYKQERERVESDSSALSRDRSDMTRRGQDRKNEKRSELMAIRIGLLQEAGEHLLRNARWKIFLTKQFQTSFPDQKVKADSVSDVLLEQCFLPRVLLSPADAEYTFRFIKVMHEWNAPGFKLMSLYDRLFNANRLRSLIFTSTVREAEYLGRFLKLILEDLSRWHKNQPVPLDKDKGSRNQFRLGAYDKEGKGPSDQPRLGFALSVDEHGKPATFVDHAQFRDLLFRWHKNLNIALKSCLGGTEWMHIRNGLTVLKSILDFFPAVDFMATQFSAQLQKISKQEAAAKPTPASEEGGRVDLSVAAQGALSELQRRKSKWVMVQAFRPNAVGSSHSEADKSSGVNSNLRPTAPDFKPDTAKALNKDTAAEEEDGEVQDGRDGKSQHADSSQRGTSASRDSLPPKPSGHGRDPPKQDETSISGSARSSTPGAGQNYGYNAPKNDTRPPTLPDRPLHNLPTRPDVPIPGHYPPERYPQPRGNDRRDARDTRDPRESRPVRDPRDQWDVRESLREPRDGRDPREARPHDRERPGRPGEFNDRRGPEFGGNVNRAADLPTRPGPQDRERHQRNGRGQDRASSIQGQSPAPAPAPALAPSPSGPPAVPETQEPAMNPERAALFAQDKPDRSNRPLDVDRSSRGRRSMPANESMEGVNPERAALIDGPKDSATPSRPPRDDTRDRGPRAQSPRRSSRHVHDHTAGPPSFDDRQGHAYAADPRAPQRNPRDRSPSANNFRDRGLEREGEKAHPGKARDASGFHRLASRGPEAEHRPVYQDQNYGRLNPVPAVPDVPSGPRGRGRGTSRNSQGTPSTTTPNRPDGRFPTPDGPRLPSPERHPPTGPASAGRGRRGGYEHGQGPSTPSGTPGGPHGDRLRGFGGGQEMPTPLSSNATPVHPDRLAQLGVGHPPPPPPPPPPGPPPHGQGRHSLGPINTSERQHTAPRHSPTNIGPNSGMELGVPTGPSSNHERTRGGGGRRQLAGINNMLQQAQATVPETSRSNGGRGNQSRQTLGNSDAQVLTGGSPASLGPEWSERFDAASRGASNGDEGSARGEHDRSRRDREGRSNRTSRRGSRDRDRERSPGRERDAKDHGEYRDRRSVGAADGAVKATNNREDRDSRRSGRDGPNREPLGPATGPGRESTGGREPRHRGDGNIPREEWNEGTRPGRGGGRDGGRELRDERGRKRRSDDQSGILSNEREKRPRR